MAAIDQLIFSVGLVALSAITTWVMLCVRILDVPNHRSSHERPIANSGGASIVLTVYSGMWIAYLWSGGLPIGTKAVAAIGLSALVLVLAGLLDDLKLLRSFKSKLAAQVLACGMLLYFDIRIDRFDLPFFGTLHLGLWAYPVTLCWVLGFTNIYNFMDGLDGLAAGTALLAAACMGLIMIGAGGEFLFLTSVILFSAISGFFFFNFPRARIFMGDVGSQFLGYVFAALGVVAAQHEPGGAVGYVVPLLFFHFLYDGIFTFFRRLLAGENVTQAHRKHLYQLLNQIGYSHARVSLLHFAMVLWQALGAFLLVRGTIPEPGWVLPPYLLLQSIYAVLVIRAARRRGLVA